MVDSERGGCLLRAMLIAGGLVAFLIVCAIIGVCVVPYDDDAPVNLTVPAAGNRHPGVGVAVVIDVSSSMRGTVSDGRKGRESKIAIARRCVVDLVQRLESYAAEDPQRAFEVGLYAFDGKGARLLAPAGRPDAEAARRLLATLEPGGGTAIGDAVVTAQHDLATRGLERRHILVITDGESHIGVTPGAVAGAIAKLPADDRSAVYVIAFDVNASVFDVVKQRGWPVLAASNATDLASTLDQLVGDRILLEK